MKNTLATLLAMLVWLVCLASLVAILSFALLAMFTAPSFWVALALVLFAFLALHTYNTLTRK